MSQLASHFTPEYLVEHGFSPEADIFGRAKYGRALTKIIQRSNELRVISLDADWGQGKTTFVHMWQGSIKKLSDPLQAIYIDAFRYDYYDDPLTIIASEIYAYAKKTEPEHAEKFKTAVAKAKQWSVLGGKALAKIAIKAATLNAVDIDELAAIVFSCSDGADDAKIIQKSVADCLAQGADHALSDLFAQQLSDFQQAKDDLKHLSDNLTTLAQKVSPKYPLVVIVDELDRCRPSFAVEVLEKIKHLFSVPNVVFLLVNNSEQLSKTIKHVYGDIDTNIYLNKFFDLRLNIHPRNVGFGQSTHSSKYTLSLLKERYHDTDLQRHKELICMLAEGYCLSPREIDKWLALSSLAIENKEDDIRGIIPIIFGLAMLTVTNPPMLAQLAKGQHGRDLDKWHSHMLSPFKNSEHVDNLVIRYTAAWECALDVTHSSYRQASSSGEHLGEALEIRAIAEQGIDILELGFSYFDELGIHLI